MTESLKFLNLLHLQSQYVRPFVLIPWVVPFATLVSVSFCSWLMGLGLFGAKMKGGVCCKRFKVNLVSLSRCKIFLTCVRTHLVQLLSRNDQISGLLRHEVFTDV
jgi:hypothetical protein